MKRNFIKIIALGTTAFFIMAAVNDKKAAPRVSVHIFTEDTNEMNSITLTCLKNLSISNCKERPSHLVIAYEILPKLKKDYYDALEFFKKEGITNPLEQLVVTTTRATPEDPHVIPHYYDHNLTSIIHCYENPQDLAKRKITLNKELCNTYKKNTTRDYDYIKNLKKLLSFAHDWQWYDTHLGVYYVTHPGADQTQAPFNSDNFSPINPLQAPNKDNSIEWTKNLDKVFNTKPSLRWSFYLMGHGYQALIKKQIFGLTYEAAINLLRFFNSTLKTDIITLLSCYTPAQRVYELAKKSAITPLNFTLISTGTDYKQQFSTGLDLFYYEPAWFTGSKTLCLTQTYNGPGLDDHLTALHETIINNDNSNGASLVDFIHNNCWNLKLEPSLIAPGNQQQIALNINKDQKIKT